VTPKAMATLAAAVIMWRLKRYYADASADDLWWILTPTARIVAATTGHAFAMEPGAGYLSRERLFLIEKSCAGINFMIAAFGMLTFAFRRRIGSWMSTIGVLAASIAASYAATVSVNAVRIAIAMWLAARSLPFARLTPADAHRLEGIAVYFCGLVLLHELALRTSTATGWIGK
jgi:exosortase K